MLAPCGTVIFIGIAIDAAYGIKVFRTGTHHTFTCLTSLSRDTIDITSTCGTWLTVWSLTSSAQLQRIVTTLRCTECGRIGTLGHDTNAGALNIPVLWITGILEVVYAGFSIETHPSGVPATYSPYTLLIVTHLSRITICVHRTLWADTIRHRTSCRNLNLIAGT